MIKQKSIPSGSDTIPPALSEQAERYKAEGEERAVLNPNCSEAVMRLKIDKLSEKEIKELDNLLKDMDEGTELLGDDEDNNFWYDTSWKDTEIFGMRVMEIKGETPFNNPEELENKLRKKLKFFNKVKVEIGEN